MAQENELTAFEPVDVVLDKPRRLRFTLGSLRRAQKRLREIHNQGDLSIFELLSEENKRKLGPDEIIVLVHAGLRHEDPELTEEQVEDMIDLRQVNYLAEKIAAALEAPKSNQPNGEASDPRPLAVSPGSSSGPSGASS